MSPTKREWEPISVAGIPDWVKRVVENRWSRKGGDRIILTVTVFGRSWEYRIKRWTEDTHGHPTRLSGERRLRRRRRRRVSRNQGHGR